MEASKIFEEIPTSRISTEKPEKAFISAAIWNGVSVAMMETEPSKGIAAAAAAGHKSWSVTSFGTGHHPLQRLDTKQKKLSIIWSQANRPKHVRGLQIDLLKYFYNHLCHGLCSSIDRVKD